MFLKPNFATSPSVTRKKMNSSAMAKASVPLLAMLISIHVLPYCSANNLSSDLLKMTDNMGENSNISTYNRKNGSSRFANDHCNISNQMVVDCSRRNLIFVPDLPTSSVVIRLDNNELTNISATPFHGMGALVSLNLSCNPLQYISPSLFQGLINLKQLFLKDTLLYRQKDIDLKILFQDTYSLVKFGITFSVNLLDVKTACNPQHVIFKQTKTLKRIRILELDVLIFRQFKYVGFKRNDSIVTDLTVWNIGYCQIYSFQKSHFSSFPLLQRLTILTSTLWHCLTVEEDAFSDLHNLQEYILYRTNSFNVKDCSADNLIGNVSSALSNLNQLEVLRLKLFNMPGYKFWYCSVWKPFKSLTHLKTLDLNDNKNLPWACATLLSPSTVNLDIRQHCMTILYLHKIIYLNQNLEYINAESQMKCKDEEKKSPFSITHEWTKISALREVSYSAYIHLDCACKNIFETDNIFPNLTYMKYQSIVRTDGFSIASDFSMRRPNLKYLEFTGCSIFNFEKDALRNAESLTTLKVSSNYLGKMGGSLSHELKHLYSLQILDLSNNNISILDNSVFKNMSNLKELNLSRNSLSTSLPSFGHLKHLNLLDISNNRISTVPPSMLTDIGIIERFEFKQLDISDNPLLCTCDNLDFLKWIIDTDINFLNKNETKCKETSGKEVFLDGFKEAISSLTVTCSLPTESSPKTATIVLSTAAGVLVLAVLISVLAYKSRWKIRYLYYMTKLRFGKALDGYENTYEFDAFISYSSDDHELARTGCMEHLEDEKGLKLCIHERDFKPGQKIAYNISMGIHSSRRTIVFISESFLESEWCHYELNIAQMEAMYTKRTVILLVLLDSSVKSKLPVEFLDIIRTTTYLEYPEHGDRDDVNLFWDRLAHFIQNS